MAKQIPIITYPNPVLRKRGMDIDPSNISELQTLIDDMIVTMREADGIGLAAPQVNHSLQLAVIAHKDGPLVLINPHLEKFSFKKEVQEEGCLSIPGVYGTVKRNYSLSFKALDRKGKSFSGTAEGLFARVLQHEVDHLNGILFIDRVKKITHGEIPKDI